LLLEVKTSFTGAARRNAEQIIRMELLYERAADASGAFRDQSGNLFVEQKKLQAQFENMQASIGTQLLPVIGALVEALVPLIEYLGPLISQAVESSLPVFEAIVGFISDLSDKSTLAGGSLDFLIGVIGATVSSFADFYTTFEPLILLVGGLTAAVYLLGAAFTFISAHPIIATLTLLAAAFIWVNETSKNFQFQTDENADSISYLNGALGQTAAASDYAATRYGVVANSLSEIRSQAESASYALNDVLNAMGGLSPDLASSKARRSQMAADNRARARALSSSSEIDASAAEAASAAQEKAAREQLAAQEQAARELAAAQEAARRKEEERLKKRADAYKSFADSVKSTFGGIKDSILSAFSLPDLGNSVGSITRNIKKLIENTKALLKTSISYHSRT
jgi:hypothetical protein